MMTYGLQPQASPQPLFPTLYRGDGDTESLTHGIIQTHPKFRANVWTYLAHSLSHRQIPFSDQEEHPYWIRSHYKEVADATSECSMWWLMLIVPAFQRLRQEHLKFKVILSYMLNLRLA